MMIGRAATGLSRLDEHVRAHMPAAEERPRQGRGDPCAAAPAGGPATQSGQARVHAERPHPAGRALAPPPHPEAAAAPPADASGHYLGSPEPSGLRTSSKVHPERVGCKWPARKRISRLNSATRLPERLWITHGPLPRWRAE